MSKNSGCSLNFIFFYHLEHVCVQNLKLCSQNLFSKGKNDFINTSCSYDVIKLTKGGIFIIVLLCKCVHRRRPKQNNSIFYDEDIKRILLRAFLKKVNLQYFVKRKHE